MTTSTVPKAPDAVPRRRRSAASRRPLIVRLWWILRDYSKRVWDNSGEDNIFFMAGGIAFNILLAAVPFVLLLLSGLGYLLNEPAAQTSTQLWRFIQGLLPPGSDVMGSGVQKLLNDIIATRGSVGLLGLIGFVWFSTRLFGSLRTVLAEVFDIEQERGIVEGKLFDIKITVVATILFAGYTALTTYLNLATERGADILTTHGIRADLIGQLQYWLVRLVATSFITLMFFSLYKFLPKRRIRWQAAGLAAVFTGLMFELAKSLFTTYLESFNPGSFYTGTLAAIVVIVFWTYYSALIFILGGEVGQVYELRRVRRLQREVFEW